MASGRPARAIRYADRFRPYTNAVEDAFGADVDYAQLVKFYGEEKANSDGREWYSPVRVMAAVPMLVTGKPDTRWTSTSFVERQNLTIRMQMRRFARLTNGSSKRFENLKAMAALHFAHYNFVRLHSSIRMTPAMAPGVTDHLWDMGELLEALE